MRHIFAEHVGAAEQQDMILVQANHRVPTFNSTRSRYAGCQGHTAFIRTSKMGHEGDVEATLSLRTCPNILRQPRYFKKIFVFLDQENGRHGQHSAPSPHQTQDPPSLQSC